MSQTRLLFIQNKPRAVAVFCWRRHLSGAATEIAAELGATAGHLL